MADQKEEVLSATVGSIEKEYGEGSIMKLGESQKAMDVPAISTGALTLDQAIGTGGIPRGRVTEIFGPESSGKTTLALETVAQAQKDDGIAAFIDVEHALDPEYAQAIGVDIDELYVAQPNTGEEALEITEKLVRSGALDIVAVDSVASSQSVNSKPAWPWTRSPRWFRRPRSKGRWAMPTWGFRPG